MSGCLFHPNAPSSICTHIIPWSCTRLNKKERNPNTTTLLPYALHHTRTILPPQTTALNTNTKPTTQKNPSPSSSSTCTKLQSPTPNNIFMFRTLTSFLNTLHDHHGNQKPIIQKSERVSTSNPQRHRQRRVRVQTKGCGCRPNSMVTTATPILITNLVVRGPLFGLRELAS